MLCMYTARPPAYTVYTYDRDGTRTALMTFQDANL